MMVSDCVEETTIIGNKNETVVKKQSVTRKKTIEISDTIAVIDVETTIRDEIMSVGVAYVDANALQIVDLEYYLITPFCYQSGMFSSSLDVEKCKRNAFFYRQYKKLIDSVVSSERSQKECIDQLQASIIAHGVKSVFAYNGHFDKRHLLELDGVEWFDLMVLLYDFGYNRFLQLGSIVASFVRDNYNQNNYRIERNGTVYLRTWGNSFLPMSDWDFVGENKDGRVRLKKAYKFPYIMRCFPGCEKYEETHNGLFDAIDEATALIKLGFPKESYLCCWIRDTKAEKEKRVILQRRKNTESISFEDTLAMSYNEYVQYLLDKYGMAKDDYFHILTEEKWREYNFDRYRDCKRGNIVTYGRDSYPIVGTKFHSTYHGECDIYDRMVYWHYPEEGLYISWGIPGNYSRTNEGLVCHHIDEDKAELLTNPQFASKYPASYQRKDRLVYCDYIEHLLLHYKCSSSGGYKVLAEEIKGFLNGRYRYEWQLYCMKRVLERFDDVMILEEKHIL